MGRWPQSAMTKSGNSALNPVYGYSLRGNVVAGGVGLRGTGGGTIVLSGIPAGSSIVKALLYWATIGTSASFVSPSLNGTPVDGALIGADADTCWLAQNNFVYRADVTSMVGGNGSYVVAGLPSSGPTVNDSQGASLIVIYQNLAEPNRGVLIHDGAAVVDVQNGPFTYTDTISGFTPNQPLAAEVTYLVGDGQTIWLSGDIEFNNSVIASDSLTGTDGDYWDTVTLSVSHLNVTSPSTTSFVSDQDCLLWAATILSVAGTAELIFIDGFEAGNTGAWGAVTGQ